MTIQPVKNCHETTINQKNIYHRDNEAQKYDILDGPLHQCTFRTNPHFGTWYKAGSSWTSHGPINVLRFPTTADVEAVAAREATNMGKYNYNTNNCRTYTGNVYGALL